MRPLEGKTILVTGGSSGIGRACAIRMANGGARLLLLGRDPKRLESAVGPESAISIKCDLGDSESIRAAVLEVRKAAPELQGCILAAGVNAFRPLLMESQESLESLWKVNVAGTISLLAAITKARLLAAGSSVVLFSSASARVGGSGLVSYASTKGAIEAATRSMAAELGGRRIRVNAIAPGLVRTPMSDRHLSKLSAEQCAALELRHLLGFGTPEDLTGVVAFLLSEESRWITGSVLTVDGGFSIS